jgi:hypothetical protein
MSACCSIPAGPAMPCPSCEEIGPIVGVAPVRPHQPDAAEGAWQHCATPNCAVVYYLETATIDADTVLTQVGSKATDRPTPVCFCFAHTVDDLVADAVDHDGVSTIRADIKQAVADGHCACEHLNPSTKCCLADIHRTLKVALAIEAARTP